MIYVTTLDSNDHFTEYWLEDEQAAELKTYLLENAVESTKS